MHKHCFRLICLLLFVTGFVRAQEVIKLYPGKAPGSEEWNWSEQYMEKNAWNTPIVYNVADPTLTVFKPAMAKANGAAVVICPGGGFLALSIESEGFGAARWLAEKGVTCFVLKYRLAKASGNDPIKDFTASFTDKAIQNRQQASIPLGIADGKAAIAYVRAHAADFGIDPKRIGIMGFSAGGTVAASALFGYTPETKPDFAAPIYAFMPPEMQGSVAADAPPLFLTVASNDQLNLQGHSVALYNKWNTAKKPVELHAYASGGHGFGVKQQHLPSDSWIERFWEWLQNQGFTKK